MKATAIATGPGSDAEQKEALEVISRAVPAFGDAGSVPRLLGSHADLRD